MLNALSFDVEECYHAHYFNEVAPFKDWPGFPSRVVESTGLVLDFLAGRGITATFFVLGWVAEQHADLVRRIHAAGHEIATHGYRHAVIYGQSPDEFSADLRRSVTILQDITGEPILGHRASAFSITDDCLWALDVMEEAGLRYDSSIFPRIPHDVHGVTKMERHAHRTRPNLWEMPVTKVRLSGRIVPVAGGGYFRILPYAFSRWGVRRVNAEGHQAVVYLHPWEFDPELPRVPGATFKARFRNRYPSKGNMRRLARLCKEFAFAPIREVFADRLSASHQEE